MNVPSIEQVEAHELKMKKSKEHFEKWWFDEGSGITPKENEELEEFARRITEIAWSNGIYSN